MRLERHVARQADLSGLVIGTHSVSTRRGMGVRGALACAVRGALGPGLALAVALAACERQPAPTAPGSATQRVKDGEPGEGASRPRVAGGAAPRLVARCITPFPEPGCDPAPGFPAVSRDGAAVAVIDRGPDTGWGGLLLTVRVLRGDGEVAAAIAVVTQADHERFTDDVGAAFAPAFEPVLAERIARVEAELARGHYRPLVSLGAVDARAPGRVVDGMRAAFDGRELTVTAGGEVLWRREIGPSPTWRPPAGAPDHVCGPFPVGGIDVWASRAPRVAVARVVYVGSDLCSAESPHLVLR